MLKAEERKGLTKAALKELRNGGGIPAIVYGRGLKTKSISVKNSDLQKVIKDVGRNGIFSLTLDGQSKNVIVRDFQREPIYKQILHVDFLQVDEHTELDTKVSVILKGVSNGEKAGGTVKQFLHELDITAKASEIPDVFEIDITNFEIGQSVRVADIKKEYQNCTFNHEDEEAIVMVDYVKTQTNEEEEISEVQV